MPVDVFQVHFKPADFFESNPAIDVPSVKDQTSVLADGACCADSGKL